jgi:ribosomal protein L25 (general stress protein Ctc)
MKKYVIGFIGGIIVSGAIFIPILITELEAKLELGKNNGKIDGLVYSVRELEKEFGAIDSSTEHKRLYSVKTSDVVSVEINGVKTVRVIP